MFINNYKPEEKKKINQLIQNGYFKFKLNKKLFQKNLNILNKIIKKKLKQKYNLENFHKSYEVKKLNELRLHVFREINKNIQFRKNLFESSKENIEICVGSELCTSDINLSIQFPDDSSSLLDMHTDFFSGESLFQVNLWIPFVNVKKTQSMFIINPEKSIKILKEIKNKKKITFEKLFRKNKKKMKWIDVKKGEAIIFSPNCLHGNIINSEKKTRWSINIRYKNLFSPYTKYKNEKEIGSFYKPFVTKAITNFNLVHSFDEIIKE